MGRRRDTAVFVFFRRTIEIKLQAVFLHTANVIETKRHRFMRKSLNAFRNGTRGLRSVNRRRGQTNDRTNAHNHRERSAATKKTQSAAGDQRGRDSRCKERRKSSGLP